MSDQSNPPREFRADRSLLNDPERLLRLYEISVDQRAAFVSDMMALTAEVERRRDELVTAPLDRDALRASLARLGQKELEVVLAFTLSRIDEVGEVQLPTLLRYLADNVEALIAEQRRESSGYVCGSNYCDDPTCEMEHDERL